MFMPRPFVGSTTASTTASRPVALQPPTWLAHQQRLVPQPSKVWRRTAVLTLISVVPGAAVTVGRAPPVPLTPLAPPRPPAPPPPPPLMPDAPPTPAPTPAPAALEPPPPPAAAPRPGLRAADPCDAAARPRLARATGDTATRGRGAAAATRAGSGARPR